MANVAAAALPFQHLAGQRVSEPRLEVPLGPSDQPIWPGKRSGVRRWRITRGTNQSGPESSNNMNLSHIDKGV